MSEGATEGKKDTGRLSRRSLLQRGAAVGAGIAAYSVAGGIRAPSAEASAVDGAKGRPAGAASSNGASLMLSRGGDTTYAIYLGSNEGPVVRQAADELAEYLKKVTSATFHIVVGDDPPRAGNLLVIGRNNPVGERAARSINFDRLGGDGFALRTYGQTILIAGGEPRGTLYGVYWVLDRLIGIRWFAADYTVIPRLNDLSLPAQRLNGDHMARFQYREIYAGDATDPAYRQHNLLNGANGQYQTPAIPAGIDTWSSYWPTQSFGGTFETLVTDESLWYGGQLLCMDPETRADAAAALVKVINQQIAAGDDPSYGFVQQDGGWTPDPASQAFATAHGGALSAPMLDMVNDVLAKVRTQIPDARVSTQAYLWSFEPPTGMQVSDGVVLTIAPIDADFAQPLFTGHNAQTGSYIKTWCGLASDVVLWDYLTDFGFYLQPFPDWWAVGEGIQTLADYPSAQGYFGEAAYTTPGIPFAQLQIWVVSRLLWDPTLDPDELIREFVRGYYGPGADSMYQYLKTIAAAVSQTQSQVSEDDSLAAAYLDFDTMRLADMLLAGAQAEVESNPDLLDHVLVARLGIDYIILVRASEFEVEASQEGISWNPDTARRLARFEKALRVSGLTSYSEGGGTPAELLTLAKIATMPATPPKAVSGLPDSDWVDYQEPLFRLYAPVTSLVQDASASNGWAVKMPGDTPQWGVQLPLSYLPAQGSWTIYITVRADVGTAAPTDTAISAGVYTITPGSSDQVNISAADLTDGLYHEIALPGVYQSNSNQYVYIAPGNLTDMPEVYVDRIFAAVAS